MPFKELKADWDSYLAIRAANLQRNDREQIALDDSFMGLRVLFDVASSLDSIAYSYSAMLKLQQEREKRNGK